MVITRQCLWCYHHDQSHCENSPGSFDVECRLSTPKSSRLTWAVSPSKIGCCRPYPPSPLLLLLSKSWQSFYHPSEDGRLSRPRHYSKGTQPVPKAVCRSSCHDKQNRLWCDSNLGPHTAVRHTNYSATETCTLHYSSPRHQALQHLPYEITFISLPCVTALVICNIILTFIYYTSALLASIFSICGIYLHLQEFDYYTVHRY